jgi:hypothetical protein
MTRFVLVLLCLATIMSMTVCLADDVTGPMPGDGLGYPPECNPLQPAPGAIEDLAIVLVTGALLTVF